jgi:hypothetical protein
LWWGLATDFTTIPEPQTGWPIVFRSDQISTPQSGAPNLRQFSVKKYNLFFSYPALSLNVGVAIIIVAATAMALCKISRLARSRTFSSQDLFWVTLAFGVAAAIVVRWEFADLESEHIVRLLGADLDRPKTAALGWYSPWIRMGLGFGTVCGVLFTVRIFVWILNRLWIALNPR